MHRYNVTVKSSLYAKYYFELRALFKDNQKEFPLKPLDKGDAEKLEIRSKDYKDTFQLSGEDKKSSLSITGSSRAKPTWD